MATFHHPTLAGQLNSQPAPYLEKSAHIDRHNGVDFNELIKELVNAHLTQRQNEPWPRGSMLPTQLAWAVYQPGDGDAGSPFSLTAKGFLYKHFKASSAKIGIQFLAGEKSTISGTFSCVIPTNDARVPVLISR